MGHSSFIIAFRILLAAALSFVGLSAAIAQSGGGPPQGQHDWRDQGARERVPVYQRKAFEWHNGRKDGKFGHFDRRFDRRFPQQQFPDVQAFQFTRPYPYHLDYYKMRWGGSYAPYFGNLYGPPQVVTAPPYYGPYYGGWGAGAEGYDGDVPNGYGVNGWNGMPVESPALPLGSIVEGPAEPVNASGQPATPPTGESLPAPRQ